MTILEQYNNAIRITETSPLQRRIFTSRPKLIASDTETTGVVFNYPSYLCKQYTNGDEDIRCQNPVIFGLSAAIPYRNRIALFWGALGTDLFEAISTLLSLPMEKTWHNARYDLRVCKENHIEVGGTNNCTLTMARIYWDRRKKHSLQSLSEILCPEISDWEEPVKKELTRLRTRYTRQGHEKGYVNYSFLPQSLIAPYSMTDSFMALMLYEYLKEKALW